MHQEAGDGAVYVSCMRRLPILAVLAACTPEPDAPVVPDPVAPAAPSSLIAADAWQLVLPEDDPFDDRAAGAACDPTGFDVEGGAFEVNTATCAYGTFVQPALRDAPAGARVLLEAWHLELWAPEAAEGHLAVLIGSDLAEIRPAIPGPSAAYTLEAELSGAVLAGDPIHVHIHNHGSNSWYVGDLSLADLEVL